MLRTVLVTLAFLVYAVFAFSALAATRIVRDRAQVRAFQRLTGYPKGRPGYVVDHIIPLCAGGADHPSNMQWQEKQASYDKDSAERRLCAALSEYWPAHKVTPNAGHD